MKILSLVVMLVLWSQVTYADDVKPSRYELLCGNPEGAGAVFYNFNKLIIYYTDFTHPDDQKVQGYPEDLKFEKFNTLLTAAIEKNFEPCLMDPDGKNLPVIVVPPPMMALTHEENLKRDELIRLMYDPQSLAIVISVGYKMGHHTTIGVEEYGHATYSLFRVGLKPEQAILPYKNNRAVATIFPKEGDKELREQLNYFFKQIRLVSYDRRALPKFIQDQINAQEAGARTTKDNFEKQK